MNRICQECGDSILGRVDKKFCSDQCRTSFNNKLNLDSIKLMRNVNRILRRNRKILKQLKPAENQKLHRDRLILKGFNFNFFTSMYSYNGNTYFYCYEFGYMAAEPDFITFVRKEPWEAE